MSLHPLEAATIASCCTIRYRQRLLGHRASPLLLFYGAKALYGPAKEVMPMKFISHDYQQFAIDYIKDHPTAAVFLDMGL